MHYTVSHGEPSQPGNYHLVLAGGDCALGDMRHCVWTVGRVCDWREVCRGKACSWALAPTTVRSSQYWEKGREALATLAQSTRLDYRRVCLSTHVPAHSLLCVAGNNNTVSFLRVLKKIINALATALCMLAESGL